MITPQLGIEDKTHIYDSIHLLSNTILVWLPCWSSLLSVNTWMFGLN